MAKLHVISFNVPYPADYGGVIGVYYHLKALKTLGLRLHLHCFSYGRSPAAELEELCEEVMYYPRKKNPWLLFDKLPYIVATRKSQKLLDKLLKDGAPILFEGSHVCHLLGHPALRHRLKIVRMHNIEWQYYYNFGEIEKHFFKRRYFYWEAKKLKKFELNQIKKYADHILAVSPSDEQYFEEEGFKEVHYVSAFHQNEQVSILAGKGVYALFQGDLSVHENEAAAIWLAENVFANTSFRFVVAGRSPKPSLIQLLDKYENIELKTDLSHTDMEDLIRNAQINILYSFQNAGMKLKLLNALYMGRHCMVNPPMVNATELGELCIVCDTASDFKEQVRSYWEQAFGEDEIARRAAFLNTRFSNTLKAKITKTLVENSQS